MSLSPRFLDELRNRINLSDIIGRRVKVTRAGREFKACCPFHHEKTPSFTINDDKQFYHCFGCGAHGDVIKFVTTHDNLSFMDAVEMLAAEAGLQVPRPSPQEAQQAKKQKDIYDVMEDTTVFFQDQLNLPHNHDALRYLIDRGFSMETIAQFRLGFSPADGQILISYLKERGHNDKDLITAGIAKKSKKGSGCYAFFRDRVMFPVMDRRGRVVAFGGRVLPEYLRPPQRTDFTPPKYINSSETPIFHKGKMLYGEPTARRAAAQGQAIILVEGYLDVIACVQAGVEGAMAPMGTSVTEEQILAMWGMIPDVTKVPILCFDGDNAGRKAAQRVCDRILPLLEPGKSVNIAFMPDGEDPDSLIKEQGVKGVQKVFSVAMPLFNFLWNMHVQGKDLATPEARAGVTAQLESEVARIAHRDVQAHYKSQLRQKISDTFFARRKYNNAQFSGSKRSSRHSSHVPVRPAAPRRHGGNVSVRVLVAAIINHPHIFDSVEESFGAIVIREREVECIRQSLIAFLSENDHVDRQKVREHLENEGFSKEIGDICKESVYVHASFCSPSTEEKDVQSKWLEYWNDINSVGLGEEIQNGWKRAFLDSDEKEEEKLRGLLSGRDAQ